jgi:iron complex transport system permease protein
MTDRGDLRLSLVLGAAALLSALLSLGVGSSGVPVVHALLQVAGRDAGTAWTILTEVRLPRVLLGLAVGGTLGLCGAALQGLLRNPLAEPGIIGTSSGAALGAVLVFYFGLGGGLGLALPMGGVLGALATLAILYTLAGRDPDILTLILAGVAINTFAGALTSLALNLAPSPFAAFEIMFWLLGSLADRSLEHVYIAIPLMLPGWLLIAGTARALDALTLGEETASSLGIDLRRTKLRIVVGTGIAVGAAVSVSGAIGFVGLVVPHLLRPFVGHEPGRLLLPSALGGAALLTLADILARALTSGPELKLGVVTALVGAPFFLHLMLKLRRTGR